MTDDKQAARFLTAEEEKLTRLLLAGLRFAWRTVEGVRKIVFEDRYALYRFHDAMMRQGDDGFALGAQVFLHHTDRMERPVRSIVLTLLARNLSWHDPAPKDPSESSVAHFAIFVNAVAERSPRRILQWVEDMETGLSSGLERQPTAVIRGILLAPSINHKQAFGFWKLAAVSRRFPCRIFFDPCRADEGTPFSAYHLRAFGTLLAFAPPEILPHVCGHLRLAAIAGLVEARDDAGIRIAPKPLSAAEAGRVLRAIAGHIAEAGRRAEVEALLLPPPKPDPPRLQKSPADDQTLVELHS